MKRILKLLLIIPLVMSCDKMFLGKDEPVVSYDENIKPPPALNDGWDVSDLATQNIKADNIYQLIKYLQGNTSNIHSLIIIKNGKLVSESYFDGWNRNRLHALRSDSKSFISTLVGIAIDQGQIKDVNQKVFDFFPEYADLNNEQKNLIEIRHILTMSPGLQWDESTYFGLEDDRNDEYAIEQREDRLRYLLAKKVVHPPGNNFLYNSALPVLQSAIIKKSTGYNADVYAAKYLFEPLGIHNYFWRMNADGYVAIAPLFLTPRDMAKLGQLFLDGGKWKGKQVVSSAWVEAASSMVITNTSSFPKKAQTTTGYGYNWWTEEFTINQEAVQTFAAEGSGGQYIFVVPGLNAVVVFTGGNYKTNQNEPYGIMATKILPAMM